ncbi:MAG: hypothetical protein KDA32_04770 [Phycisphaerales bacterium]|nr:hypothetical protein [Phycisphaerales bacterium]
MRRFTALALLAPLLVASSASGGESEIRSNIRAFFETDDVAKRQESAARIESDPAFDRAKMSDWLHTAGLIPAREPGVSEITVPLRDHSSRRVLLRLPSGYTADRAWPLIYALHGQGGRAEQIMQYVEHILGDDLEQFVIAAPDQYDEVVIHHTRWPPTGEHPALLGAIRRAINVNSGRVYCLGYSRGGHTSWTLGVLHADQFAGVVPLAGTFLLEQIDGLWDRFLPSLAHTRVLCVWGALDLRDDGGQTSGDGGIAGLNRKLRNACASEHIPATLIELPDADHFNVLPPADKLRELLKTEREHAPETITHRFRHPYQARAYWLEGHDWTGRMWDDQPLTLKLRAGESELAPDQLRAATIRAYSATLGELSGERKGQSIRVSRRNVKELTVWLFDGMIDWGEPVELNVSGRVAFKDKLTPSVFVCLSQAARTYDFDRLCWAGLRYSRSRAKPVTAETDFPDPFGE